MDNGIYIGTELKFAVNITSTGFNMLTDDWKVEIVRGPHKATFTKEDAIFSEGQYYICFDTAEFGSGTYYAIITAYIPDTDFPDGLRTEVTKITLCKVEMV